MSEIKTTGPFGLWMGMLLDQLDAQPLENATGKYLLTSVPKPHSAFDTYIVQVGLNNGLAWIKEIGKDIATSVYGIELKSEFNNMKKKLDKVYGKSELTDILLHESIWDEPKDWMRGLINKQRILMFVWDVSKGSNLKNDVISISLIANASDSDNGYISIEYEFENSERCDEEIAALEDDVL